MRKSKTRRPTAYCNPVAYHCDLIVRLVSASNVSEVCFGGQLQLMGLRHARSESGQAGPRERLTTAALTGCGTAVGPVLGIASRG